MHTAQNDHPAQSRTGEDSGGQLVELDAAGTGQLDDAPEVPQLDGGAVGTESDERPEDGPGADEPADERQDDDAVPPLAGTMTEPEFAAYFGVSTRTITRRRMAGEVPHYRLGTRVWYDADCVREYLELIRVEPVEIRDRSGRATRRRSA